MKNTIAGLVVLAVLYGGLNLWALFIQWPAGACVPVWFCS